MKTICNFIHLISSNQFPSMSLLFVLASIGVLNGFIISVYLLVKKNRATSDLFFAGLVFTLSIRIGKSILFYFDRSTDKLILQIGLSFCILIGPFFYHYIRSIYSPEKITERSIYSFLGLGVAIFCIGVMYPYTSFPGVWNGIIIYFIYGTWIVFTLLGLRFFIVNRTGPSKDRNFIISIVVAYLFITLTYQLALFGGITYIWGSLIFSLTFYYLGLRAMLGNNHVVPKTQVPILKNGDELLQRVNIIMQEEKLYLNKKLKLDELASKVDVNRQILSQVLNQNYKYGFAHYLKSYRVNEAKELIKSHPEWSLDGIGNEAGFHSKSSFYDAFRKIENQTPAEFRRGLN